MFRPPQSSAGGGIFGQVRPGAPTTTAPNPTFGAPSAPQFAASSVIPGTTNPIFGVPGAAPTSGLGLGGPAPGAFGPKPEEKKVSPINYGFNPPAKEEKKSPLAPGTAASGGIGGGIFSAPNPPTGASRQTFGPAPAAPPLSGGLFSGNPAPATTAAAPSVGLFSTGNPPATTSTTSTGGLFSAPTATNPATTAPASGGLFGVTPATTSSAPTHSSPFGAPSSTAAPSGGLFGTTPATSTGPTQSPHFGAPSSTTAPPSFSLPSSAATTSASTGFSALTSIVPASSAPLLPQPPAKEEKKADSSAQPYAPVQSLEEVKAAALNTKTMDEVFTKWRTTLTQLSSDFSVTAEEVKQKEIMLYEKMDNIFGVLEMCENLSTVYEQQKEQLETISKEQEYLNRCLNSISAQIEPYVKSESGAQTLPVEERLTGIRSNYLSGSSFTSTREEIFHKSKNVGRELDEIENTLDHITNLVNQDKSSEKSHEGTERILNSYYDTLKWIEGSTSDLKTRLQGIEASYNKYPQLMQQNFL